MNENEYGNNGQYSSLREQIPEGLMEHLPEGVKDKIEDVIAEADQKLSNPYERVEPDIQKTNMNSKIAIATVVIGFGGVLIFAKINPLIAVLIFGLMLVVFGIGIVVDKNFSFHKNAMSVLVLIFGIYIVLITGYLLIAKYNTSLPKLEGRFLSIVIAVGFISIGAFIMIFNEIGLHYLKKACTERVQAVCVYIKEKREYKDGRSHISYAPVFEFQCYGKTYCVSENYRYDMVPAIGERCELFINPNNIKEFYRKGSNSRIGLWIICITFIMFGVLVLYLG